MSQNVLTTAVVGSYPQPEWLFDRGNLVNRLPPRVRAKEMWRIPPEHLEEAQEAATLVAIRDQERAGVDVISDGEIRRESYSNRVATALGGIDTERTGTHMDRTGNPAPVPLVSGPIRRERPIEVEDVRFLRANTDRTIKITLPGPFTMTQQAENAHYPDEESLAMAYADAVNEEIKDLFAAGADIVQLDEPYVQARPEAARGYAVKAINRALEGVDGKTALHLCFGYAPPSSAAKSRDSGSDHASACVSPSSRVASATIALSNTWQPAAMSDWVAASISLWLIPSSQGMKIMPVGATRET